ncbi:DUF664 domain-containing protein [Rhodococcus qingshengii]|nr:DUF664 domain-containing protein [Rhodococcus qingshengii]
MEKLLEEYRYGYQLLKKATEGLSEEELRFNPEANKWSIHQILIHVADSELVSTQRMKKVLSEEVPLLMSFDQDAWADTLEYEKLDREQHLHLFKLLRSSMLPILEQLPAEKWERMGIYADAGPFTLRQLLEYRIDHVRGHLAQIARVREAYQQNKI